MITIKNIKKRTFLITIALTLGTFVSQAQISFPDNVDDEAPAAPIDGFVTLGLAAGAYFGLRKKLKIKE